MMIKYLPILILAACSHQPPPELVDVHSRVNATRNYQNYAAKDYRPMSVGESGNCARFAATYKQELATVGVTSEIGVCKLRSGIAHAFTMTENGWILDNRFKYVTKWENLGCL